MPASKEYNQKYYGERKDFAQLVRLKNIPRSLILRTLQLILVSGEINQYDFKSGLSDEILSKTEELLTLISASKAQ